MGVLHKPGPRTLVRKKMPQFYAIVVGRCCGEVKFFLDKMRQIGYHSAWITRRWGGSASKIPQRVCGWCEHMEFFGG